MFNGLEGLILLNITNKKPEIVNGTKNLYNKIYDSSIPKYILGINYLSERLIETFAQEKVNLHGIINDYADENVYKNINIFKLNEIPKDSFVISCVVDGRLRTALENIENNSILYNMNYLELCLHNSELYKFPEFCYNNFCDIDNNKRKYRWLYEILADDKSKETLNI